MTALTVPVGQDRSPRAVPWRRMAARAAGVTALVLATVSDFAVLRPDPLATPWTC